MIGCRDSPQVPTHKSWVLLDIITLRVPYRFRVLFLTKNRSRRRIALHSVPEDSFIKVPTQKKGVRSSAPS